MCSASRMILCSETYMQASVPIWKMLLGPIAAFVLCFLMTPQVKRFAENVGAIDEPKIGRAHV